MDKRSSKNASESAERQAGNDNAPKRSEVEREQYFKFFQGSADLMVIADPNGAFLKINPACSETLGYSEAELISRPFIEFVHPDDKQETLDEMARQQKTGNSFNFENRYVCKDGSIQWLSWRANYDQDEGLTYATARDITERKQAEEALFASQKIIEGVINAITVRVFWKDNNLVYLGCNAIFARDAGFVEPKDVIGKTDYQMGWSDQAELYRSDDREVIDSGRSKLFIEEPQTTPEGDTITLLTSKAPLRDSMEEIIGVLGTYIDITERKRAEQEKEALQEQLAQSQKVESVGRLAGGIAHDFNNALQVILGNTDLAMRELPEGSELREPLDSARKAAEHSAALTQQLLSFARQQTIKPKLMDLNETVAYFIKMIKKLIGEDISLSWEPLAEPSSVMMDPTQAYQIVANLCTNARDSIEGVGKVAIVTRNVRLDEADCEGHIDFMPGEYVVLEVRDEGRGMEKEVLEHLFEPFFTTSDMGKGTGLGLATVYGIVMQSKGFIDVQSELGQGTSFTIYLPLVEGEKSATERLPEAKPVEGHGETILLVEDEIAILRLGVKILEGLGYKVIPAATPEAALQEAREHIDEIEFILTDVIMPQMNGQQLASKLRELKPELKCLFMSGYTDDIITRNGVLENGTNFIQKPFSMEEIAQKIRCMIDTGTEK